MKLSHAITLTVLAGSLVSARVALAQPENDRPVNPPAGAIAQDAVRDPNGRRVDPGEPTKLSFKEMSVSQLIPFIAESTGKIVFPARDVMARSITVISDQAIPRQEALDMVFLALERQEVAVIEHQKIIYIVARDQLAKYPIPVLSGKVDLSKMPPSGTIWEKIYDIRYGTAANISETIKNSIPDFGKMSVDADSNQIVVIAPLTYLQRIEQTIRNLDRQNAATPTSETFQLKYADADAIAQNIRDLYSQGNQAQGGNRPGGQGNQGGGRFPGGFQPGGQGGQGGQRPGGNNAGAAPSAQLRVTSNAQQNAVTVVAEQEVLDAVRRHISEDWDKPADREIMKAYPLKYTDPVKLKAVLDGLFAASAQNSQNRNPNRIAGQFTFQAIPDDNKLVVVGKNAENMSLIDEWILSLDVPKTSGLPDIIELKHANAEDLAEQLNALLAREQTIAQVRRQSSALSSSQSGASPFATNANTTANDAATAANAAANTMQFWWVRAPVPNDNAGASNLVGRVRIVPDSRLNRLLVLASPEYRQAVADIIAHMDRPGRQVLISAIVVELSGEDAASIGARFSSQVIQPNRAENSIGTNNQSTITGTKNNLIDSLFDTSVLNLGVNINVLLQALAQNTTVRILSEPKIFTGDNQEAEFFDGQDIPFITNSQPNTQGNIVQTFDYKAVGIVLRVRPRITPERDVDLKVNLQLSSITPGNTLFGGAIVDRRETTTQLIVQDGQTMVISGIMRTEDSQVRRKIPIIGDIPVLGWPFTSVDNVKTNTELVAFITPVVVNNPGEAARVSKPGNDQLNRMRKELGIPDNTVKPADDAPAGQPQRKAPEFD